MKGPASTRRTSTILLHAWFWTIYIVSEYFANLVHTRPENSWLFLQGILLSLPILLLVSYFLAYYVVPRYLMRNRWLGFLAWIIVALVFVFYSRIWWANFLNFLQYGIEEKIPVNKMLKNIIRDYSVIALAVCISIIHDYRQKQKLNEQLARAKADAEIKLLKSQLHPHFLFNSLNNIYSLALVKSDLTADSILKLTELLDYLVYRAGQERVPLIKEVELLEHYIDLEKLRHGDKLLVQSGIEVRNESLQVAPLILLPFAENAFKHGGPGADGVFRIDLKLAASDQYLEFQLQNSKPLADDNRKNRQHPHFENGGVGLENIQQRLALLYPGRHELKMNNTNAMYEVRLTIDFRA